MQIIDSRSVEELKEAIDGITFAKLKILSNKATCSSIMLITILKNGSIGCKFLEYRFKLETAGTTIGANAANNLQYVKMVILSMLVLVSRILKNQ